MSEDQHCDCGSEPGYEGKHYDWCKAYRPETPPIQKQASEETGLLPCLIQDFKSWFRAACIADKYYDVAWTAWSAGWNTSQNASLTSSDATKTTDTSVEAEGQSSSLGASPLSK